MVPSLSTVQYAVHPHIRGAYSACCGAGWLDPVHPHIRGAYQCLRHQEFRKTGSSPHTWGIQAVRELRRAIQRFIPTYVGHTPRRGFTASTISVHPHIRGAYAQPLKCLFNKTVHPHIRGAYKPGVGRGVVPLGSSPHTWGIHTGQEVIFMRKRFIPTYVGHTRLSISARME